MQRLDIKWYSDEFIYTLPKNKFGEGEYWVQYFVIYAHEEDPGSAKKLEIGSSEPVVL